MDSVEVPVLGNNDKVSEVSVPPSKEQSLFQKIGSLLRRELKLKETLPEDKSAKCPYFIENPKED